MFTRIRNFFQNVRKVRCQICGGHFTAVYAFHNVFACNPCIIAEIRKEQGRA